MNVLKVQLIATDKVQPSTDQFIPDMVLLLYWISAYRLVRKQEYPLKEMIGSACLKQPLLSREGLSHPHSAAVHQLQE